MTGVENLFAPFSLRLAYGPLRLRALTDPDLAELGALAVRGVHAPDEMPFYVPWTDAPADQLPARLAAYHWRQRAEFSVDAWSLDLGVWLDGVLLGTQGLRAEDFLVTRTGETGSWLGLEHQGRGVGTLMRQALCTLAFDHLGFEQVTSGAFLDNPASLAVSRKVGYRPDGVRRLRRREGELALNQVLVLDPDDFVRGPHELQVEGLGPLRAAIGLDSGAPAASGRMPG